MTTSDTATSGEALRFTGADAPSVPHLLELRAQESPDTVAVLFPESEDTYAELAADSMLCARRLRAAGVGPGDRVGMLLREASMDYVAYGLGTLRLGAIFVPINARNKSHELAYVLNHSEPTVLIASSEFSKLIGDAGLPEGCRHVVLGADEAFDAGAESVGEGDVSALQAAIQPEDPALILYTSGTTANPKGCLISHRAMLAAGRNGAGRLRFTSEDRMWTPLALFHIGGWQVLMTAMTGSGGFAHIGFFDATVAVDQLARQRITIVMPAFELIWMSILDHPKFPEADLSALRIVMNVGVEERMVKMQERVPQAAQISMFGMTESMGSICMGETTDPLKARMTTSGRALPDIDIRIVDPEGNECPPGVPGELTFRGSTAFSGYYRDPEITAKTVDADGYIATGDLVVRNDDGSISFMSRLKDMLKVGGENVSAAEIEGYLITHPGVGIAAVVGAPDARYGEVPAAFVQRARDTEVTEQELIDYCIGKIATYKVPRYVRFVDEYPVSASQKIQKNVLRDRIESDLREQGITEAPKLMSR